MGTAGAHGLYRRTVGVFGYRFYPEPKTLLVSLRHSDGPTSGQSIPEKEGRASAYPVATMPAEDEKLGDIAIIAIAGCRRPARN